MSLYMSITPQDPAPRTGEPRCWLLSVIEMGDDPWTEYYAFVTLGGARAKAQEIAHDNDRVISKFADHADVTTVIFRII